MSPHARASIHSACRCLALAAGLGLAFLHTSDLQAQEHEMADSAASLAAPIPCYPTVHALKGVPGLHPGMLLKTAGFHAPGDGGEALYRVDIPPAEQDANGADIIALTDGLVALLLEGKAVNYRMFGALGDGTNDDGVAIKLAHEYANRHRLPVINRAGEFWISESNAVPIQTNVDWGNTVFHIDERFNSKQNARFVVLNDEPTVTLELDEETKAALLAKIRPGVQIIPELAAYAGHLITVLDTNDRIGRRAGYARHRGWAREELFYVEEEGRIIGDIAWAFSDITSMRATPCNRSYLVIQGGGFLFSGDSAAGGTTGYHHHGIAIRRSRTIVREQWMGLEPGKEDVSMHPRAGFYVLNGVFDVTLENIRAMPWEKNRRDPERVVPQGTYGIGGARMLNCTFRNLTAEAGWVAWGVFGTNLNKNFTLENCRLNRVDVHFHCWNLTIRDCEIGFKGISITGGGDLLLENTTRHGTTFISFRPDYGAKWDGNIRLRGCTLKPTGNSAVSVLSHRMGNVDYQYPIGFSRSVVIEDLLIDYSAAPDATAPCWLMNIVPFSKTTAGGHRLFFPTQITFRNIRVSGRSQGVRLLRIPNPQHYDLGRPGGEANGRFTPNCALVCDAVQLEALAPQTPDDSDNVHLLIGGAEPAEYADNMALFPDIRFRNCEAVRVFLGHCTARAAFAACGINTITAPGLRGELTFDSCHFQPTIQDLPAAAEIYNLAASRGTRFTNCTFYAPIIAGELAPELLDRSGILDLNGNVRYNHLNTGLGEDILNYCRAEAIHLNPEFIGRLKLRHDMEE